MSTPDSIPTTVLPVVPRLTVVPRPVSPRDVVRAEVAKLPLPVVAGIGIVAILTVWAFSSKIVAADLSTLMFVDTSASARLLGTVSFLSIVLIVAAIAMLQRGLRSIPTAERISRQVTVVAAAGAYLLLILWFSRFIAALMSSAMNGSLSTLMPSIFWWG